MMKSTPTKSDQLIFDGKGYVTPLQSGALDALDFVRRDIEALPRAPQYRPPPRKAFAPRPPFTTPPDAYRSAALLATGWALGLVIGLTVMFWVLYAIHTVITPVLPTLPTGIVPFGPMSLVSFSIFAFSSMFAGIGLVLWWLRSTQN